MWAEQKAQQRAEGTDPSYRVWGRRKDKKPPRSSLDGLEGGGVQETWRKEKRAAGFGGRAAYFLGCVEFQGTAGGVSEGTSSEVVVRVEDMGDMGAGARRGLWGVHSPTDERQSGAMRGTHSIKEETAQGTSDARI